MPAILLTIANVDALKLVLRRERPEIKSGHLTESLAYGLGYNTQASLLAAMKITSPLLPALAKMDTQRVTDRLFEFGHASVSVDFLKVAARSPKLPDRIWTEFPNGDLGANNDWYHECNRRNIPMMYLQSRRKYVRLNWDCITTNSLREKHVGSDNGAEAVGKMIKTFESIVKDAPGKPIFDGAVFDGSVDRLLPGMAFQLADEFFKMLYEPMQ